MRVGALLAAIIVGWLSYGTSVATAAGKMVTVADIVAAPRAFVGRRVLVSGFLSGVNGWLICSPPLAPDAGARADYGAAHCIDVRSKAHPFHAQLEKYNGAVVVLDAIYWHRCLPEVRTAEPEVIRETCNGRHAANGELGPLGVRIEGYAALRSPRDEYSAPWTEVDLAAPAAKGIDGFVRAFVAAAAARDVDALLQLFDVRERGRRRVWLRVPTSREYWLYLAGEMAPRHDRATVPGRGYRLYEAAGFPRALCFCREASCEGRWPIPRYDIYESQSVASPTVCFPITRARGTWLLD